MKSAIHLSLLSTLLLAACDSFVLLPELASFDGSGAARLDITVDAAAMPGDQVQAVELDIADIMLRHTTEDAWALVSPESTELEITDSTSVVVIEQAPLMHGGYDTVSVAFDHVRVEIDGTWHEVELEEQEFEIPAGLDLDSDAALRLSIDLQASLSGDMQTGWHFAPSIVLEIGPPLED